MCNIKFHNLSVGLGHLQGDLYLLSLDNVYSAMNVDDVSISVSVMMRLLRNCGIVVWATFRGGELSVS